MRRASPCRTTFARPSFPSSPPVSACTGRLASEFNAAAALAADAALDKIDARVAICTARAARAGVQALGRRARRRSSTNAASARATARAVVPDVVVVPCVGFTARRPSPRLRRRLLRPLARGASRTSSRSASPGRSPRSTSRPSRAQPHDVAARVHRHRARRSLTTRRRSRQARAQHAGGLAPTASRVAFASASTQARELRHLGPGAAAAARPASSTRTGS